MITALVTGANRGIGLELCRLLKERGDFVIAACRTSTPELDALGVRVEQGVDVTSDSAVADLVRRLGDAKIDLLINNAGMLHRESLTELDLGAVQDQFEVNAVGPLRLTAALVGHIKDGGKIAMITSRMGSIGDNSSGGYYGYRMSKAALNIAAVSMARDLAGRGICVAVLHPGAVRTGMTGGRGNVDPPDAAAGLLARIDELTPQTSGSFLHASGEHLPW